MAKLTTKKLLSLCKNDFRDLDVKFNILTDEEKIQVILSTVFHKIYERFDEIESLKFSDLIKKEPHLDYGFYKLAKYVYESEKKTKSKKRPAKKFGIFDIEKIKRRITVDTDKISEEEFRDLIKSP